MEYYGWLVSNTLDDYFSSRLLKTSSNLKTKLVSPVNADLYMAFNHHFSFATGALSQDFFLYSFD